MGNECEEWSCNNVTKNDNKGCNKRGICIAPDECLCDDKSDKSQFCEGYNKWELINGEFYIYAPFPTYNDHDVYNSRNGPGARHLSSGCKINGTKLFVFGGRYFYNNDLFIFNDGWYMDTLKGQWKWVTGRKIFNHETSFGTLNVYSDEVLVGSRYGHQLTPISDNEVVLSGGDGFDDIGEYGLLNSVFYYKHVSDKYGSSMWKWVTGDKQTNILSTFGSMNVYDPGTKMGSRYKHITVPIVSGSVVNEIWFYGGFGCAISSCSVGLSLGDSFFFNVISFQWKYIHGNPAGGAFNPVYGHKDVYEDGNSPGRRALSVAVQINDNEILMFGGLRNGGSKALNDVFKFNIISHYFKWVGGSQSLEIEPIYHTKNEYNEYNLIGSRCGSKMFLYSEEEVLIFGGRNTVNGWLPWLNDVFLFNFDTLEFNWIEGGINDSTIINIPRGRTEFSGAMIDDRIWIFGGSGYGDTWVRSRVIKNCFGIKYNLVNVCSFHGTCVDFHKCECFEGFYGIDCNITLPKCYNLYDPDACNGENGICLEDENCSCSENWGGEQCTIPKCYGKVDPLACNNNKGICIDNGKCSCYNDWSGKECTIQKCYDPICFGVKNRSSTCNSSGVCRQTDKCDCFKNIYGDGCYEKVYSYGFFSNDGMMINIQYEIETNFLSSALFGNNKFWFDCGLLVEKGSLLLLGNGSKCKFTSISSKTNLLHVILGSNAKIRPHDILILDLISNETVLVEVFTAIFPENPILKLKETYLCQNGSLLEYSYSKDNRTILFDWTIHDILTDTVVLSINQTENKDFIIEEDILENGKQYVIECKAFTFIGGITKKTINCFGGILVSDKDVYKGNTGVVISLLTFLVLFFVVLLCLIIITLIYMNPAKSRNVGYYKQLSWWNNVVNEEESNKIQNDNLNPFENEVKTPNLPSTSTIDNILNKKNNLKRLELELEELKRFNKEIEELKYSYKIGVNYKRKVKLQRKKDDKYFALLKESMEKLSERGLDDLKSSVTEILKSKQKMEKGNLKVNELINTERKFIRKLKGYQKHYVNPLKNLLTAEEFKSVHNFNVDNILSFSESFQGEIDRLKFLYGNFFENFINKMLNIIPEFNVYIPYYEHSEESQEILEKFCREKKKLREFLKNKKEEIKNFDIDQYEGSIQSYMMLPITRLTYLHLFFKEILKIQDNNRTTETNKNLSEIIKKMNEIINNGLDLKKNLDLRNECIKIGIDNQEIGIYRFKSKISQNGKEFKDPETVIISKEDRFFSLYIVVEKKIIVKKKLEIVDYTNIICKLNSTCLKICFIEIRKKYEILFFAESDMNKFVDFYKSNILCVQTSELNKLYDEGEEESREHSEVIQFEDDNNRENEED